LCTPQRVDARIQRAANAWSRPGAKLALRYGKPLILFGPREAFGAFPAQLERTQALERVCAFLQEALRRP